MKKLFAFLLAAAAVTLAAAEMPRFAPKAVSPRKCVLGKKSEITLVSNGKLSFEVVADRRASRTVKFAAAELAKFLGEITGTKVDVLQKATGKKCAFLVGALAVFTESIWGFVHTNDCPVCIGALEVVFKPLELRD